MYIPRKTYEMEMDILTWKPQVSRTWRHKLRSISTISRPSLVLDKPCKQEGMTSTSQISITKTCDLRHFHLHQILRSSLTGVREPSGAAT